MRIYCPSPQPRKSVRRASTSSESRSLSAEIRWDEKAGLRDVLQPAFGVMPRSRIALETGMHSPWISRLLGAQGHEVIVAHATMNAIVISTTSSRAMTKS